MKKTKLDYLAYSILGVFCGAILGALAYGIITDSAFRAAITITVGFLGVVCSLVWALMHIEAKKSPTRSRPGNPADYHNDRFSDELY